MRFDCSLTECGVTTSLSCSFALPGDALSAPVAGSACAELDALSSASRHAIEVALPVAAHALAEAHWRMRAALEKALVLAAQDELNSLTRGAANASG